MSCPNEKDAPPDAAKLAEYYTGGSAGLFSNTKTALRLSIRTTPAVPYEKDFSKWTSPMEHGAVGDGQADDTEAVQKALSAPGKTHVVLPSDKVFRVTKPLTLGEDVVRVVGTHGRMVSMGEDPATVTVGDGKAPVVVLEGMNKFPPVHVRTARTVVLDSVHAGHQIPGNIKDKVERGKLKVVGFHLHGTGEVFISNTGTPFVVDNPKQRVWIRHYNAELGQNTPFEPVVVKAGVVWILGWKSENLAKRVTVYKDGAAEVIGFNNYRVGKKVPDGPWPIFEVIDGQFSCDSLVQTGAQSNRVLVWETRGGKKRILDAPTNGGRNLSLYCGYDPAKAEALRRP